jgi:hypothetical protein
MTPRTILEDPRQWERVGGRELQFFATDAEVRGWLTQHLLPQYAPYHLVGSDLVEEGGIYVEDPFQCEADELLPCMYAARSKRYNFRCWSEVLTPWLQLRRGQPIGAICSLSGLVLLQHGLANQGRRDVSRIAIADKARHIPTGEVVQHTGYLEVYQTLRREIKKSLRYACVWLFPNGTEVEDDRLGCWTEGAAREYGVGVPFLARPGRRLEPKGTARRR